MELDLDLARSPGRPRFSEAEYVRDLTESDIALLGTVPRAEPTLKRLRDTHHAAARAIAAGMKTSEVAFVTGYTPARITSLLRDPSFKDLVAFYRSNLDVVFVGLYEKMSAFSQEVLEELRFRFETDPSTMSNSFLNDLLKTLADRSGHGPKSTQVNINIDLAGRLEAARRRAETGGAPVVLKEDVSPPPALIEGLR